MDTNKNFTPCLSPIGMLQEEMWPDVWKILVVCILHNQTSRKQVDRVYQEIFYNYPTEEHMASADPEKLAKILKPLGLYNRRSKSLIRFSREYVTNHWQTPSDLHGCGKYADDCYKVFCRFQWNDVEPTDHALNDYVKWARKKYAGRS